MAGAVSPTLARERELRVWDLACRGWHQRAIAIELSVSQPAVSKILRRITKRELARLDAEIGERRVLHTAFLEYARHEAMLAWESSKKAKQKSRTQKTVLPPAPIDINQLIENKPVIQDPIAAANLTVREVTTKEASKSDGDSAFLALAVKIDEQLRELWGINAPKRLDITDKRRPLEKLSDQELQQYITTGLAELAGMDDSK